MQQTVTDDQEISLRDIINALLRQRWVIIVCMAVAALTGLLYAVFTQPIYSASTTIRPVIDQRGGGLGGLASQFGGLASMAGINLGGGGSDKEEYLAILRSRELAERFMTEQDVLPHLFPDLWDDEADRWIGSEDGSSSGNDGSGGGLRSRISSLLVTLSGDEGRNSGPRGPGPSMWDAYKEFSGIRSVNEDVQTGIVTVTFRFRNPVQAAEWANGYVAMANREIRENTVREAERALEYLNREVERTQAAGLRETIYALVETQLERIMLAQARDEYSFKILDRAVVPEERSHPNRILIVILALIVGGIIGSAAALLIDVFRRSKA